MSGKVQEIGTESSCKLDYAGDPVQGGRGARGKSSMLKKPVVVWSAGILKVTGV